LCQNNCLTCSVTSCSSCVVGYYPAGKLCNLCQNIISYCLECVSSLTCTKCQVGYALSATQRVCQACSAISNCAECSLYYKCDKCKPLFYLNGYYCQPCTFTLDVCCTQYIPNCARCLTGSICAGCNTGYFYAVNDTSNSSCLSCGQLVANCSQCATNTICAVCNTGFFLDNTTCSYCADFIPNCLTCYSSSICSSCSNGLIVSNGTCVPCPAPNNRSDLFYVLNN
jgi:proprotein convertase subtilisin/kexin type 5